MLQRLRAAGLLILMSFALFAQETPTSDIRHFTADEAASEIRVDGVLDEEAWRKAVVIDLPYEWYPGDNVRPPVETECLITFDKRNLYIAFRAYDPEPSKIRAHLMDRDSIANFVQDDHVGVNLDTFNDERQAIQFRVNPLGVQVDGTFDEFEGLEDFAWDAIWDSKGVITDQGYEVEIAIPFKQIRYPRSDEPLTWGVEAFRNYPRDNRHRISSRFTDRDKDCTLCQENKVSGIIGPRPGLNLEVTPTLTGVQTDRREDFPNGPMVSGDEDIDAGGDIRWGVTPNFTLNATVNPDFSQVEADTAQLDINTRFALFFPEKRPFFLEGADYFETPLQVVFTRTVADPEGGLKFTGKEGKNAVGSYLVEDQQNNLVLPSNQGSRSVFIEDNVTSGVARYRRDVGARSVVGVLYAGREGTDYHNRVAGVDGFIRFNSSNSARFQYVSSDTQYPDEVAQAYDQETGSFTGDAINLSFLHRSRKWVATGKYEDKDPKFRADSGFMPRVDVRSLDATVDRRFWGTRTSWHQLITVGFVGNKVENHDGDATDQHLEVNASVFGPRQSQLRLKVQNIEELYAGTNYEQDRWSLFGEVKVSGDLVLNFITRDGDAIDYNNGRPGEQFLLNPGIQWRVGRHFNSTFDYLIQKLDVAGGELFNAELAQAQLVYQFNARSFIRGIFQYQEITRDPELYFYSVDEKSETLFTQLLFSYKINPRTVLFAGYTDNRAGYEFDRTRVDLTQLDRTFFLKVGYAFLR